MNEPVVDLVEPMISLMTAWTWINSNNGDAIEVHLEHENETHECTHDNDR